MPCSNRLLNVYVQGERHVESDHELAEQLAVLETKHKVAQSALDAQTQELSKVTDLVEELRVLRLYHKMKVYLLKHFEEKTTLEQDLAELCSE